MKTPEEIATHCTHSFGLVFGDVTSGRLARQWAIASARLAQGELAKHLIERRKEMSRLIDLGISGDDEAMERACKVEDEWTALLTKLAEDKP